MFAYSHKAGRRPALLVLAIFVVHLLAAAAHPCIAMDMPARPATAEVARHCHDTAGSEITQHASHADTQAAHTASSCCHGSATCAAMHCLSAAALPADVASPVAFTSRVYQPALPAPSPRRLSATLFRPPIAA